MFSSAFVLLSVIFFNHFFGIIIHLHIFGDNMEKFEYKSLCTWTVGVIEAEISKY